MRPCASIIPSRTLLPLPRFLLLAPTRSRLISPWNALATSAVRSVEPSSTTMTSVSRLLARIYADISASVTGKRSSSLKDGITMESSGGTELIVAGIPSSRAHREVERSGKTRAWWYERYHGCARSAANPDFLHRPRAQPFFRLRQVAREEARALMAAPQPREWRRTVRIPANQAYRRRSARERSCSRGVRDAQRLRWQAPRGTPR